MDIKEYISSGILEGYVLGTLSEKERKEVECMSHIYEEIKIELNQLEISLEKYALENPKKPDEKVKQKLMAKIHQLPIQNESTIISINKNNSSNSTKIIYTLIGAAAGVALLLSIGYFTLKEKDKELIALKKEITSIKDDYQTLDANIIALSDINENLAHELKMFRSPEFKTVFLAETNEQVKGSLGIICWNKNNHQVMIAMENMPEIPTDKQMQLWAIVDGNPVSLGVLPNDINSSFKLLETVVAKPNAFAITLEKQGGSEKPTLDQMLFAGNI